MRFVEAKTREGWTFTLHLDGVAAIFPHDDSVMFSEVTGKLFLAPGESARLAGLLKGAASLPLHDPGETGVRTAYAYYTWPPGTPADRRLNVTGTTLTVYREDGVTVDYTQNLETGEVERNDMVLPTDTDHWH